MAAEDLEKELSADKSAEILVSAIEKDIRPLDLMTKKAFENAISVIMAIWRINKCGIAHLSYREYCRNRYQH